MINSDPQGAGPSGLPLVLELRSAFDRSKVAVGGTIVAVVESNGRRDLGYRCVLDDGTGQVDLLFLGRASVPGVTVGARCHIEGTARLDDGRLTVWNPLYRLERAPRDRDEPRMPPHG